MIRIALVICLAWMSAPKVCHAGAILLDQRRGVDAYANLHIFTLIEENVTWNTPGESEFRVGGQSEWLDWSVLVEAYQQSGISPEGFWGSGSAIAATKWSPVVSHVTLLADAFSHLDVHFQLDQRTPFDLQLFAEVDDSRSYPSRTDVLLYLNGPPGNDIWEFVEDGDRTYETSGWLAPGDYYLQVWASASLITSQSDVGIAEYFVYLGLPEPSTITALAALMIPFLRRSRTK